jgi:RimJ/RimL family protein N-acetyltransferase
MPLLFSYGTLRDESVQLSAFGRLLRGYDDALPGYEPSVAAGETPYANVTFTGEPESRVAGAALEVTDDEVAAADRYEEPAEYRRVAATLASGDRAWVYAGPRYPRGARPEIDVRAWSAGDLLLLERLMGDPVMTEHLGGPEAPEKIVSRNERYCRIGDSGKGAMLVIVEGARRLPAGSVGYWEKEWRGGLVWETGWSVLPELQGLGIAARGTAAAAERARAERKHRFLHAYPSVDNAPSNAICRRLGFELRGEVDFEYPPGRPMRSNDWRLDLFAGAT